MNKRNLFLHSAERLKQIQRRLEEIQNELDIIVRRADDPSITALSNQSQFVISDMLHLCNQWEMELLHLAQQH